MGPGTFLDKEMQGSPRAYLNVDDDVTEFLLQLPPPPHLRIDTLAVNPVAEVDEFKHSPVSGWRSRKS